MGLIEHCPTCGMGVRVISGDEGTSHYQPYCGRFSSDATLACVPLADHLGAVEALRAIAADPQLGGTGHPVDVRARAALEALGLNPTGGQ